MMRYVCDQCGKPFLSRDGNRVQCVHCGYYNGTPPWEDEEQTDDDYREKTGPVLNKDKRK